MTTVIMRTVGRAIVPIILVVAASLFVEGHNLPGGGFVAGVLTAVAFVVIYISYDLAFLERGVLGREVEPGREAFRERAVPAYRRLFTLGLVVAVGSGLVPLAFELPFLSQTYVIFEGVPLYHHVELASAVAFEFGVFCVVVGGLLTILSVVGVE